MTELYVHM